MFMFNGLLSSALFQEQINYENTLSSYTQQVPRTLL